MASCRSWPAVSFPCARFITDCPWTAHQAERGFPIGADNPHRVLVLTCVIPIRVWESKKRYSPVGSRSARANRNTIRACSILPEQSTLSVAGRNRGSVGVRIRAAKYPAKNDFPFALGSESADVSIPGAVAARMKRFWSLSLRGPRPPRRFITSPMKQCGGSAAARAAGLRSCGCVRT